MEQMSNMKANIAISENNKLIVTQKTAKEIQELHMKLVACHFTLCFVCCGLFLES